MKFKKIHPDQGDPVSVRLAECELECEACASILGWGVWSHAHKDFYENGHVLIVFKKRGALYPPNPTLLRLLENGHQ